jgi:pyruvate dehydrogenase (quinone)
MLDCWPNKTMVVCIFSIRNLNQVTRAQRVMEGDPRLDALQRIPDVADHRSAERTGFKRVYVDDQALLDSAWDEAPASPASVLPNGKTDPEMSPLPSHITLLQAKNFTSTLVDDARHLIANTACPVFSAVLPSTENT